MSQAAAGPQITGQVVDVTGAGVAGVAIRALDDATGRLLATTTALDGRFDLGGREAGRFVVTATAPGFLPARYGAQASGQAGVPVRIGPGLEPVTIEIVVERPGTIHGRMTGADGKPVPGSVHALTSRWNGQRYVSARIATATTGSDGSYAIDGLGPGEYFVMAAPAVSAARPPAFHPGVTALASAARVIVAAGADVRGVDVVLPAAPMSSITATLRGGGGPLVYPTIVLIASDIGETTLQADTSPMDRPLTIHQAGAGQYTVVATALEASTLSQALERRWATADVETDGRQPLELALDLTAGASIDGRVVLADGSPATMDMPDHWLWPFDEDRPTGLLPFTGVLSASALGQFAIAGIAPGRYVMQFGRDALAQLAGWSIAAIRMAGDDVADLPLDLRAGDRFTDVEVVVTSERTELAGTIADAGGRPRTDVTLVAFPADSRYWWTGTRRIRLARPDTTGSYVMNGLPAGEYLLVAVTGAIPTEPADPAWLGSLSGGAIPVSLTAGAQVRQDLKTAGRY